MKLEVIWYHISKIIFVFFIISAVMCMFYGGFLLSQAYQTLDYSQNLRYLSQEFDTEIYDELLSGEVLDYTELWQLGANKLFRSVQFIIFGSFLMGGAVASISSMSCKSQSSSHVSMKKKPLKAQ